MDGAVAESPAAESRRVEQRVDAAEFREAVGDNGVGGGRTGKLADPRLGGGLLREFPGGIFVGAGDDNAGAGAGREAGGRGGNARWNQ